MNEPSAEHPSSTSSGAVEVGGNNNMTDSLKELYTRYRTELLRYVTATFGSGPPDPEDVTQSAFTQFAALENPQSIENPRAFLYRIAHNTVISYYRKAKRHSNYLRASVGDGSEEILDELGPERVLMAEERHELLKLAFSALPPLQQELLAMNRVQGLAYAEIARCKNMSQTEVKRQVARAALSCHNMVESACLERIQNGDKQR